MTALEKCLSLNNVILCTIMHIIYLGKILHHISGQIRMERNGMKWNGKERKYFIYPKSGNSTGQLATSISCAT